PQPPTLAGVERRRRLVEEEHARRAQERNRHVEALPVSDRERRRGPVGRQVEGGEQTIGSERGPLLSFEPGEKLEILARAESVVEGRPLRDPADAHAVDALDRPGGRRERTGEDREQ